MGDFNTYGHIQLKIGDVSNKRYNIGDKVDLADGVYIGYGGAVGIKDGTFIGEFKIVTDKWGKIINPKDILRGRDYINPLLRREEENSEVVEKPEKEVNNEVKIQTVTLQEDKWICPHCNKEIGEKELFHDVKENKYYHRPCKDKGEIVLPVDKEQEELVKKLFETPAPEVAPKVEEPVKPVVKVPKEETVKPKEKTKEIKKEEPKAVEPKKEEVKPTAEKPKEIKK